jgi:hypothetical protein
VAGWTMTSGEFGNRSHSTLRDVWAKSTMILLLSAHVASRNLLIATSKLTSRQRLRRT